MAAMQGIYMSFSMSTHSHPKNGSIYSVINIGIIMLLQSADMSQPKHESVPQVEMWAKTRLSFIEHHRAQRQTLERCLFRACFCKSWASQQTPRYHMLPLGISTYLDLSRDLRHSRWDESDGKGVPCNFASPGDFWVTMVDPQQAIVLELP